MATVPPSPSAPTAPIPPEVRRASERLVDADYGPSTEELSGGQLGYLAQRNFLYGRGGRQSSSRTMTINQRYEMREDAVIALSNLASMAPMMMAKTFVRCRNPAKAAGLEKMLKRIYATMIIQMYEAANFGWQGQVKQFGFMRPGWQYIDRDAPAGEKVKPVWDHGEIPMLVWEPFVNLPPETVTPVWNARGRFDGIAVSGPGPFSFVTEAIDIPALGGGAEAHKVPVEHSLWIVNQRHSSFGSAWGHPRLAYAFPYWRAAQMVLRILERSAERKGDPLTIVTYPSNGRIPWGADGKLIPNHEAAQIMARRAKAGSILVMPSDAVDGDAKGIRAWNVEYVKAEEKLEVLISILEYLDTMKIRAMGLAEQGLIEGRGGTSSRNVASVFGERNVETQFPFQTEILDTINRYMIPQISEQNWPTLRDEPAEFVAMPFGNEGAQVLIDIVKSKANSDAGGLPIDYAAALEWLEIPTLSLEALAEAQERMAQSAQERPAEEVKPDAKGNAGREADTGFYYAPPEHITLATDDGGVEAQTEVLAALPATRHYEDGRVLAQVVALRKTWFDLLTEQYESFARFLESDADVSLSDVDLADADEDKRRRRIAGRIVDSWSFESKRVARAIERTKRAVKTIFGRAGRVELGRVSAPASSWNPEEQKLADWMSEHVAAMVTRIEATTRTQLRDFLVGEFKADRTPQQVATNLRRHFSEFPSWRADLIAREETAQTYRAATLFAGEAAGVKQVQALDARLGPTDHPCEVRNGNIYTISEAFKENAKEHVRGTLAWRLVPGETALSIQRVVPEAGDEDWATRVDLDSRIIYVNAEAKIEPDDAGHYLVLAVDYAESRAG